MQDKENATERHPEAGAAAEGAAEPDLAALKAMLQSALAERDDMKDRLMRKQAEFENSRRRIEREKTEFMQFANTELLRELLNGLDSFEIALRERAADERSEKFRQGFELIFKQFMDILTRFGLQSIDARGQKFDPNMHQAVTSETRADLAEDTVIDQMRKGYLLNGKLLRPAMVSVSVRAQG